MIIGLFVALLVLAAADVPPAERAALVDLYSV
jgi:hypothetical protein